MGEVRKGEEIRKGSGRRSWGSQEVLEHILGQDGNPQGLNKEGQNLTEALRGSPGWQWQLI